MKKIKYTFKKEERLCSKVLIDQLFLKKDQLKAKTFPLFLIAKTTPELRSDFPAQVVFSVSKRRFKRAVDRNRIKRLLREAYRLHKHELYEHLTHHNQKIVMSIIYLSNKPLTFQVIEEKIIVLLNELKAQINEGV